MAYYINRKRERQRVDLWQLSWLPVGLQFHPAELHADRALCILGLVRDGGAERAHTGGSDRVVVGGVGRRRAPVGGASLRFVVLVDVLLVGHVALRRQTEVRPQLCVEKTHVATATRRYIGSVKRKPLPVIWCPNETSRLGHVRTDVIVTLTKDYTKGVRHDWTWTYYLEHYLEGQIQLAQNVGEINGIFTFEAYFFSLMS